METPYNKLLFCDSIYPLEIRGIMVSDQGLEAS
jgi:hypothetical protein